MKKTALLIIGLLLIIPPLCSAKITAKKVGSKINVSIDNKFFTSYVFSDDEKYPFLFPVNGPLSGGSVTSMRNGEYPHHASIFLACDRVNGGNYWYDRLERGQIISVNALTDVTIGKTGHSLFCARIATDLNVQNGGTMINAEGEKNEKETWGKKSVWIDYIGKRGSLIEWIKLCC